MADNHKQSNIVIPQVKTEAGGGIPSATAAGKDILPLHSTTLKYLRKIWTELSGNADQPLGAAGFDRLHQLQQDVESAAALKTKDTTPYDYNRFLQYIVSPTASALAPPSDAEKDLNRPLPEYFISTSHNTYLSGHQLYGKSSVEPYKNVLLRGCRCIEIDVWDGENASTSPEKTPPAETEKKRWRFSRKASTSGASGDAGANIKAEVLEKTEALLQHATGKETPDVKAELEMPKPWVTATTAAKPVPRVLHGHTLTKDVSFRDVCVAIRESAFVNSDLPVIVSLEVHACLEQQETMVEIMKEEWKGLLVEPTKESDSSKSKTLPSPNDLRKKILVKVKYNKTTDETEDEVSDTAEDLSRLTTESSADGADKGNDKKSKPKKKKAILQALSAMGIYTKACHFSNFTQSGGSFTS
jgi:hypothetical protein